ncbi:MAG: quinol:cytochrome C oxidoreductase [Ignavibacteria bacterium]|nr:quinol:cytochrome C oxidoreductase [Ignavibacteria bacterium]
MTTSSDNAVNYVRKTQNPKFLTLSLPIFAIGLLGLVAGFIVNPTQASFNLVVIMAWLLSIGVGSMFFIGIEYLSGAVWSVPFRRIAEINSSLILIMPILAIPIILNIHSLYHWTHQDVLATDEILQRKSPYLNETFFIIRNIIYYAVWVIFYFLLTYFSNKQDLTKDQQLTRRNTVVSAIFMPFFALTLTFFAIDWLMSLEPHWYSTIFGVYYFSGTVLAAISAFTYISIKLNEEGYLVDNLKPDHFYSMGALLFAFTNFWAYIAFSQFMLIWYANLPEETFWFINRGVGSWLYMSIGIIFVKFIVPYILLLPQPAKMNPSRLKFASLWILFAHYYDLFWIVMPTFSKERLIFGWIEIASVVFAVGTIMAIFLLFSKNRNLVPIGDPKLKRSLEFHL